MKILNKLTISFIGVILLLVLSVIFFSSALLIYEKRHLIVNKLSFLQSVNGDHGEHSLRFLVNPLKTSNRQVPPKNITDLIINKDANVNGQWSAPFDWNVTSVHAALLPDETVITYGVFGVKSKEEGKDIRSNKKLTLTDGRVIDRDGGSHQWAHHDVNSGVDFDIWDYKLGVGVDSHILYNKPVVMDAFCSILRVLNLEDVFILGGNKNQSFKDMPDTQKATMIYNTNDNKFRLSEKLNYKRWYGSVVITGDQKMVMMGGEDIVTEIPSIIPEIIDLEKIEEGWSVLKKAESYDLFGGLNFEWHYPRAFLASDGNIIGISYNKLWVMNKEDEYRVSITGEIPLVEGGISKIFNNKNPNYSGKANSELQLLTISSAVGHKNSVIMIDKDKLLVFGGKQREKGYSSSNHVYLINFENSFKPKITKLKSMLYPRSDGNATILPDGNVFINGGTAFNDLEFSNLIPEIYNPNTQITSPMEEAFFRRNYHATSLLLPDGRILVTGGDVWNAEIFYPPYLFEKDFNNNTVLAKKPKINNINKTIKRGDEFKIDVTGDISRVTLISTGSTTHAQGSESKFRNLDFEKISDKKIKIDLSVNPNDLQNGTYLIFVLDSKNVPSNGKIIYLN